MVGLTTDSCAGFKVNRRRQIIATDTSTHRLGDHENQELDLLDLPGPFDKSRENRELIYGFNA